MKNIALDSERFIYYNKNRNKKLNITETIKKR